MTIEDITGTYGHPARVGVGPADRLVVTMRRLDRWLGVGADVLLRLFAAACLLVVVLLPLLLAAVLAVSLVQRWP